MKSATTDKSLLLNTYIAEFNNLRAEQLKRIDSQNQAMSYLFLIIGASASAIVASVDKPSMPLILCWIALFLPIATAPLAFMFFDNEMAIHSIGSHIYWHLRDKNLTELVGDKRILEPSLEFLLLHRSSRKIHGALSRTRWSLFLLPTLLPVAGMFIWAIASRDWWLRYEWWSGYFPEHWLVILFGSVLWVIGLGALCLEAVAVIWTFIKHDRFSDSLPGGLVQRLWREKASGRKTPPGPLPCSFSPDAKPAGRDADCSVKFDGEKLVVAAGQKGAGDEPPEQVLEIPAVEIDFVGIKRRPRAARGRVRFGGGKPRELFIELKGDSEFEAADYFKHVRDCKGRRCSLYFESRNLPLARALKEEYRRLATGYDD